MQYIIRTILSLVILSSYSYSWDITTLTDERLLTKWGVHFYDGADYPSPGDYLSLWEQYKIDENVDIPLKELPYYLSDMNNYRTKQQDTKDRQFINRIYEEGGYIVYEAHYQYSNWSYFQQVWLYDTKDGYENSYVEFIHPTTNVLKSTITWTDLKSGQTANRAKNLKHDIIMDEVTMFGLTPKYRIYTENKTGVSIPTPILKAGVKAWMTANGLEPFVKTAPVTLSIVPFEPMYCDNVLLTYPVTTFPPINILTMENVASSSDTDPESMNLFDTQGKNDTYYRLTNGVIHEIVPDTAHGKISVTVYDGVDYDNGSMIYQNKYEKTVLCTRNADFNPTSLDTENAVFIRACGDYSFEVIEGTGRSYGFKSEIRMDSFIRHEIISVKEPEPYEMCLMIPVYPDIQVEIPLAPGAEGTDDPVEPNTPEVTPEVPQTPVYQVTVTPNNITISVESGKSLQLTANTSSGLTEGYSWTSNNTGVAEVTNGLVTGKASGTVVITATGLISGKSSSVIITVTAPTIPEEPKEPETPVEEEDSTVIVPWNESIQPEVSLIMSDIITRNSGSLDVSVDVTIPANSSGKRNKAITEYSGVDLYGVLLFDNFILFMPDATNKTTPCKKNLKAGNNQVFNIPVDALLYDFLKGKKLLWVAGYMDKDLNVIGNIAVKEMLIK